MLSMRRVGELAVASVLLAWSVACGGSEAGSNIDPAGGSSGTSGSSSGGGGGINVDGGGSGGGFNPMGGWGGGVSGSSGASGSGSTCDLPNCHPPAPATPCCIADLCGGNWGDGCQPFSQNALPGDPVDHVCNHTPQGTQAAPPPAYAGICPVLVDGTNGAMNTILSSGSARRFMLAVPLGVRPEEKLPVVFLWHWLGGDAVNFYNKANAGVATNQMRFIAVFPEAKGDLALKWPYAVSEPQSRFDEEFRFFDDMYACIAQQFNVQPNCIASGGVSAGALFTDQLAGARSQYIAAFASMSGGTGGVIRPWANPQHKSPAIVLWGGTGDQCGIDFNAASINLEQALTANGHFLIECIHECNHSEPPFPIPTGQTKYAAIWQFVFDHPYWLGGGQSPYVQSGLSAAWPTWCAIGMNNAVPGGGSGCVALTQCL
jgi:predicted esterase